MPIAQPRYLFADQCPHDSARCFMAIPVGEGENILSMSGMIEACSVPGEDTLAYMGPYAFLEHNIVAIYVPFDVAMTLTPPLNEEIPDPAAPTTKTVPTPGGQDVQPRHPQKKSDWDRLFRSLVFEMGIDGDQFYGAEVDGTVSAHTYDPIENVWLRRPHNQNNQPPGAGEADDVALQGVQDEPFLHISDLPTYGPRGVRRIFSDERMLATDSVTNVAKGGSTLIQTLLGTVGLNDMAYRDTMRIQEPRLELRGPGYILVGAIRFQVDVPTYEFATSMNADGSAVNSAAGTTKAQTRAEIINALMTGDHQRIEAALQFSTTGRGDLARTLVFGGDNSIVQVNALGKIMLEFLPANSSPIRANPIMYAGKLHVVKGTPYHLSPV